VLADLIWADQGSARRQLAFDIWWLGFALWLICIIEVSQTPQTLHLQSEPDLTNQKTQLDNEDNNSWFTIFNIIFELVSGYGIVGLSLGVNYDNFSYVW
jgi:hypothetical protein